MEVIQLTQINYHIWLTFWICVASSRVGDKHSTWLSRTVVSNICRIAIENVAVLPVPDCACAITSLPFTMGFIDLCCIAEGFSKPVIKDNDVVQNNCCIRPAPNLASILTTNARNSLHVTHLINTCHKHIFLARVPPVSPCCRKSVGLPHLRWSQIRHLINLQFAQRVSHECPPSFLHSKWRNADDGTAMAAGCEWTREQGNSGMLTGWVKYFIFRHWNFKHFTWFYV